MPPVGSLASCLVGTAVSHVGLLQKAKLFFTLISSYVQAKTYHSSFPGGPMLMFPANRSCQKLGLYLARGLQKRL